MTRSLRLGMSAAMVLFGSACSDTFAPADDYALPEPDHSLDPGHLVVGEFIATPCDVAWNGRGLEDLRQRNEWALVDIHFGRDLADAPAGPLASDIRLVAAHGGRVLYQFNVPAVRARILLSRVPDLVENGEWITVRAVPDPTRYDVPSVSVGFTRPLQDSDIALYESLGGRVDHRWDSIQAMAGVLPDRSVPLLRSSPDIEYVEAMSIGCLGSGM